jgi:hypothetical protein
MMQKFKFVVSVMAESLDTEVVAASIKECLTDALPAGVLATVKDEGGKPMTHQGYLVARKRVFGIGVDEAGDGANPKPVKAPNLEAPAETAAE